MQYFHPFVLPFFLGFVFVISWVVWAVAKIMWRMPRADKRRAVRGLFSLRMFAALAEIGSEVLLHRRIWRQNRLLGFMHMSFAFGWFMLIVTGWAEAAFSGVGEGAVVPIWCHIFFRFFFPGPHVYTGSVLITQLMDAWLALILVGQCIAVVKRLASRMVGMKLRPRHSRRNRAAMTALWCIFPLRLIAESISVAVSGGGGFLTGSVGMQLALIPHIADVQTLFWWLYSLALGVFFFCIPASRYLHIPTEAFLIMLRHWRVSDARTINAAETMACSACGMCLSGCPLARKGIADVQPVYFVERLREQRTTDADAWRCLHCGRCQSVCPVGVHSINLRQSLKGMSAALPLGVDRHTSQAIDLSRVVLFGGCMGKLTPRTRMAMEQILDKAGAQYAYVDAEADLCCGRPLRMNGKAGEADMKMAELTEAIIARRPSVIVTTCPICYNALKNRFGNIAVYHHADFICRLAREGAIHLRQSAKRIVYHDPCELSRIAGIEREPIEVLNGVCRPAQPAESGKASVCCGGSLAAIGLRPAERTVLARSAAANLLAVDPQAIATACPLCKRTLATAAPVPVVDIAEVVASALEQ